MFLRIFLVLSLIVSLTSCTKDKKPIYETIEKTDPYSLYKEGLEAFNKNDYFYAEKKFSQAELNFKDVNLAAKSAVMASYSLYGVNSYDEAIDSLNMYLKTYPLDKNVIYAHYLIAVIHFEQITDEKKDLKPILNANEKISFFIKKYPNTEYTIDLKFKKNLIENQLAAKEMYVAKYYISTQKWIPAINRLKTIVKDYSETVFIEEALHRLVEVYYRVGLIEEAKTSAIILGYNYNSSEWYSQSYKILNKNYKMPKKLKSNKDKESGLIKRTIKRILN
jgi:outer membrane protein assembly factor BamD